MVSWEIVADDFAADTWDELLCGFGNAQIFQAYGWGEFKRSAGWQPLRLLARAPGAAAAGLAQVLLRKLPGGFRFAWVPGGPCLAPYADRQLLSTQLGGFLDCLRAQIGSHYLRCNFTFPVDPATAEAVSGRLHRPSIRIGSGRSVMLDLAGNDEAWLKSLTS